MTEHERELIVTARIGPVTRSLGNLLEALELWDMELHGQDLFQIQRLVDRLDRRKKAAA